jgi:hypothetical protein
MSLPDQVLDFFSYDHRCRDEIEEWQRTGNFPDDVVRVYKSERVLRTDLRRMQAVGYRVIGREELYRTAEGGDIEDVSGTGGVPVGRQITYTRSTFA